MSTGYIWWSITCNDACTWWFFYCSALIIAGRLEGNFTILFMPTIYINLLLEKMFIRNATESKSNIRPKKNIFFGRVYAWLRIEQAHFHESERDRARLTLKLFSAIRITIRPPANYIHSDTNTDMHLVVCCSLLFLRNRDFICAFLSAPKRRC